MGKEWQHKNLKLTLIKLIPEKIVTIQEAIVN